MESPYGSTIVDIYKFDVKEIAGDTVSVFMIFAAGSRQAAGEAGNSQIDELVVQLRWSDGAFEFGGHRRPQSARSRSPRRQATAPGRISRVVSRFEI